MKKLAFLLLIAAACASNPPVPVPVPAPVPEKHNDIAAKTAKMQKLDGYLPLFWDADGGKLYLEIARLGEEMIDVTSLPGGVGSNPIGLDRNEMGETRIVRFHRVGPNVPLLEPNP